MLVYGRADLKRGPGRPGVVIATTESAGGVAHVVYAHYESPLYVVPQKFFVPNPADLRGLTASQKRKRETSPFSVGSPVEFESFESTRIVLWITIGHTETKLLHYENGIPHLQIPAVSSGRALWTKEFLDITNELGEKMKDELARVPCNTPLVVTVALELHQLPAVPELLTFSPSYSLKAASLRVAPSDASRSIVEQAPWNDPRTKDAYFARIAAEESRPSGLEQQNHASVEPNGFSIIDRQPVRPQSATDAVQERESRSGEVDSNSKELQSLVQRILINDEDRPIELQDHMYMGASSFAVTDHKPVYPQGATGDAAEKRGNQSEESDERIIIDDDDRIELLDNASVGACSGSVLVIDDNDDGIEVLNDTSVGEPLSNLAPALQALDTMADDKDIIPLPKKEEDMAEECSKREEMQNMRVWYSMGDYDGGDAAPL